MGKTTFNTCVICGKDIGFEGRQVCRQCEEWNGTTRPKTKQHHSADYPAKNKVDNKGTLFEVITDTPF